MSVGGTFTIELLDSTQQLLVFPGNIDLVRDDGYVRFDCGLPLPQTGSG